MAGLLDSFQQLARLPMAAARSGRIGATAPSALFRTSSVGIRATPPGGAKVSHASVPSPCAAGRQSSVIQLRDDPHHASCGNNVFVSMPWIKRHKADALVEGHDARCRCCSEFGNRRAIREGRCGGAAFRFGGCGGSLGGR
jgi:hypothetical protein